MFVLGRRAERYQRHLPQYAHVLLLELNGQTNHALTVTESPLSALWLFGSELVGVVALARRKSKGTAA